MHKFNLAEMAALPVERSAVYHELLRVPALSAGLYRLAVDSLDPQQPHNEDEMYFVLSGRGKIVIDGEVEAVQSGDLVYVGASVEHRFFDITEPLEILVVFAPAET